MYLSQTFKIINKKLAVCLLLLAVFNSPIKAEFISTAAGVFQSTLQKARIIVSYDVTGIFFIITPPIGLQEFDPSLVEHKDSRHLFIAYDPATNRYNQLLIGEKSYRIIGSFSLLLDDMRISVDHNNTYLTVSVDADQSIMGFRGLEVIVNTIGDVASALLEANQFADYADLILPYEVVKSGELQKLVLDKKDVSTAHIGLSIQPPTNPCSKEKEFLLLKAADVNQLKTINKAGERTAFLGNAFVRNIQDDLLAGSVLIRTTRTAMVYFDIETLTISSLSPMRTRFDGKVVCIKTDYQL